MPVDVEAYMAGAIPALSRGGSWLPGQGPGNGTSLPPLQPQSAYGSSPISSYPQTPPTALGGMSGSPVIGGPLQFPKSPWARPPASPASVHSARSRTLSQLDLAGSASTHGLKRESALGPVKHNGWLKTGSEALESIGGSIYQESIGPRASVRAITPSHSPSGHLRGSPSAGDHWERQAGSPKPSSREPDYIHKNQSHPPTEVSVPITSPYRKISGHDILQPSPYRRVTELLPPPPSEHSGSSRPSLARRHTHNPLHAPKPRKHQEEDLYRSAQLNNRLARLSLAGRECHTPDPHSAPHSPAVPREASHSSRSRRHSSSDTSSSSSLPNESAHHKSHKHAERTRHLSTPHGGIPLVPSPSSASPDPGPSAGSALEFTSNISRHIPSSPQLFPQAASNLGGSYKSSPNSSRSRTSSVTGLSAKKPVGYISPMDNEEYDPYEAHPAAPVPDRTDRHVNSAGLNVSETSPSPQTPLSPAKKEYVPPGFAKPTREVPWNREGPAMKTHGIAWLREGDPHALPTAPKGPRWDVARPPRIDQTRNGSWWESSGGRVNSYNVG
ncbi:hypothetical protein V865_001835 [Kwoniella europaea PYCC6329]|uniref:Uncharacterized protein n=1 Tax=Kwoniella europaea PYCC6329 TaxID=1423913 RepID=A0AAX4KCR8_9TREE